MLRQPDTEAPLDHGAKADPAPAHPPIRRRIRPGFDDRGRVAGSSSVNRGRRPGTGRSDWPGQPFGIGAVDPFVGAPVPRTVADPPHRRV